MNKANILFSFTLMTCLMVCTAHTATLRAYADWKCTRCFTIHSWGPSQCTECSKYRPEIWACTACGKAINHPCRPTCLNCKAPSPFLAPWACALCETVNNPCAEECESCTEAKTWSCSTPCCRGKNAYCAIQCLRCKIPRSFGCK